MTPSDSMIKFERIKNATDESILEGLVLLLKSGDAYSKRAVNEIKTSKTRYYFAWDGDKVVGIAGVDLDKHVIKDVAVDKTYRRKGIATELNKIILESLATHSAREFVRKTNTAMLKLLMTKFNGIILPAEQRFDGEEMVEVVIRL